MSRSDVCTICLREGHTASSCPADKRRRTQGRASTVAIVAMVAALAGGVGHVGGYLVDMAINAIWPIKRKAPTAAARPVIQTSLWRIRIKPWALGRPVTVLIEAQAYDTVLDMLDRMYPSRTASQIDLVE